MYIYYESSFAKGLSLSVVDTVLEYINYDNSKRHIIHV
jgi:hypothetical protein